MKANQKINRLVGNKYWLLRTLGSGGMGDVYEAENERTGGRVALKLLHPQFGRESDIAKRFEQEARAATRIGHPNIVKVLDLDWDPADGALYMVQELLTGTDLRTRLRQAGRLTASEALAIATPIADALATAHEVGVLHRDIKPPNIFLATEAGGRMVPKLIDFGVAKMSANLGSVDVTRTHAGHSLIGTLAYMSPEQLRDQPDIDGRSDQWAFGIVLYQMLTGTCPFSPPQGDPPSLVAIAEFVDRVTRTPAPRLEGAVRGVPHGLAMAIHRMLEIDRDGRYRTMREAHAALVALRASATGGERTETNEASTIALSDDDLLEPKTRVPSPSTVRAAATTVVRTPAPLVPAAPRSRRMLGIVAVCAVLGLGAAGFALLRESVATAPGQPAPNQPSTVVAAPLASKPPSHAAPPVLVPEKPAIIGSEPAGAIVLVDGKEIGTTPMTSEGQTPPFRFVLRLKGYEDAAGEISTPGQKVSMKLTKSRTQGPARRNSSSPAPPKPEGSTKLKPVQSLD